MIVLIRSANGFFFFCFVFVIHLRITYAYLLYVKQRVLYSTKHWLTISIGVDYRHIIISIQKQNIIQAFDFPVVGWNSDRINCHDKTFSQTWIEYRNLYARLILWQYIRYCCWIKNDLYTYLFRSNRIPFVFRTRLSVVAVSNFFLYFLI